MLVKIILVLAFLHKQTLVYLIALISGILVYHLYCFLVDRFLGNKAGFIDFINIGKYIGIGSFESIVYLFFGHFKRVREDMSINVRGYRMVFNEIPFFIAASAFAITLFSYIFSENRLKFFHHREH